MYKFLSIVILSIFYVGGLFSDLIPIRAFDLGGNGLKTALLTYDTDTHKMQWKESQIQLGKCPDEKEVKDWIRFRIKEVLQKDLDEEVSLGYLFGFSLAGLNKMRTKPLSTFDMSSICNLPADKVVCIDDGTSHLIASLNTLKEELPKGPIWNFGIGTGVSIGYADNNHNVGKLFNLHLRLGTAPWNIKEPKTGKSIWRVCGAKSFDEIVLQNNNYTIEDCFLEFAKRWKSVLDANILNQQQEIPAAIIFTGGHVDVHGSRLVEVLSTLEITVPLFTGAPRSGLLGAAWNAISYDFSQTNWFQSILSYNTQKLQNFLESGVDINERNALGYTALALAIQKNQLELASLLIQYGAWVDNPDFSGIQPLSVAVQNGNISIVKLLLENGANINSHDYWGRTALFFAQKIKNKEIEELLTNKGAQL